MRWFERYFRNKGTIQFLNAFAAEAVPRDSPDPTTSAWLTFHNSTLFANFANLIVFLFCIQCLIKHPEGVIKIALGHTTHMNGRLPQDSVTVLPLTSTGHVIIHASLETAGRSWVPPAVSHWQHLVTGRNTGLLTTRLAHHPLSSASCPLLVVWCLMQRMDWLGAIAGSYFVPLMISSVWIVIDEEIKLILPKSVEEIDVIGVILAIVDYILPTVARVEPDCCFSEQETSWRRAPALG